MNEADLLARQSPTVICNKCKHVFFPYAQSYAPLISEVRCTQCNEPRILYYGEDSTVAKMILSTYGVNKELNDRLKELENQIGALRDTVKTSFDDARNIMTKALIGALNEQVNKHVNDYHSFGGSGGKQKGDVHGTRREK